MKKFLKNDRASILLSLVVGTVILTTDILSRPYAAFGGGGLLFVAIVTYWIVKMEGGRKC